VREIAFIERMQRAQPSGDQHAHDCEANCHRQDPQRRDEAAPAEAEFVIGRTGLALTIARLTTVALAARQHNQ